MSFLLGFRSEDKILTKSATLFIIYRILKAFVFIYSVIVLYYRSFGLNFTTLMIISSAESIVQLVFEIPSGILADILGKKRIVILGLVCNMVAFIFWIVHPGFILFFLAEIVAAFGDACISGADGAIIYNKFVSHGQEESYRLFQGRVSAILWIVSAIASVASGVLFRQNKYFPFVLSAVFILCALLAFLRIKTEPIIENANAELDAQEKEPVFRQIREHFRINLKLFWSDKKLLTVLLLSAVITLGASNAIYLSQELLTSMGLDVRFLGIVFLVGKVTASMGAALSEKFEKKLKRGFLYTILMMIGSVLCILVLNNLYLSFVVLLIIYFCLGLSGPMIMTEVFRCGNNENRATIGSASGFADALVLVLADPLLGYAADKLGLTLSYGLLGILILAITITAWFVLKNTSRFHPA